MRKIKQGYITTEDGFSLYYEVGGNVEGIPILFLHGGPCLGCKDGDYEFFDLDRHMVILFDQRGAPRSTPQFRSKGVEPLLMVEDVRLLIDTLGIEQVNLFGGSWGGTLALLFAIHYPERVGKMLLRGTFLANKSSISAMLERGSTCACWTEFTKDIPHKDYRDLAQFYHHQMTDVHDPKGYALRWINYALCLNNSPRLLNVNDFDVFKASMIALFSWQNCFLPDDYIYHNVHRLQGISTVFIQGVHDLITPTNEVERLSDLMPKSTLHKVDAGHFAWETAIKTKLVECVRDIFI